MESQNIRIRYSGQSHQIDANTLIQTLIHYSALVEAVNQLQGGSRDIKLQVKAIEKGSFIIDIELVENIIATIFTNNGVKYISELIGVIGGVITIYQAFKGKPTTKKEVNNSGIYIENLNITTDSLTSIYNSPLVREAISKSFEAANEDSGVEGVELTFGEKEIVIEKESFKDLIYTDFDSEQGSPEEKIEDVDATMTIRSLSFESGSQWKFIYKGFNIAMNVKDSALMDAINKGARFGKGDAIRVKLRIVKKLNKEYNVYENKSFKILEFYEHIVSPKPIETAVEDNLS